MMRRWITMLLLAVFLIPVKGEESPDTAVSKNAAIDEVVVTGVRNATDVRYLPFSVTSISRQEIDDRQSTSLLDIVSEQTPGLFVTGRSTLGYGVSTGAAGQLSIRGIGSQPTTGVMVLVDGHPQLMGIMGHPISDAYQSFIAERVEVLRGPASVLYGSNAMGGVINIVTRRQTEDGMTNDLRLSGGSYGTFTSDYTGRYRDGRFNGMGSLSYNRTDGHRKNLPFEQMSGYVKLGYDLNEEWRAYTDISLTHFNASNPGSIYSPLTDNDQHITRGIASAVVQNDYGWTSGGLSVFLNWGNHKIDDGYGEGETPKDYYFRSRDHVGGFNAYQSFQLMKGNRLTAGFDLQSIGGRAWNEYADKDVQLVDTAMTEIAGYLDIRQDIGPLTLDAGMRIDHHSVAGTEFVPQFGAVMRLAQSSELKLMIGKGFRNPTLMNLFMFRPKNPDLKAERIWNYELAYSQTAIDGKLHYGANVYLLKGDNMIQTVAGHNENTGKIENWGVELEGDYRMSRNWHIDINYSFIHKKYDLVAVPKHKTYGEVGYDDGKWSGTIGAMWINHLTTQVLDHKRESYVLVNARCSYRLNRIVKLFAKGENLLAERYEINYGYPMPKATFMGGVHLSF